MIKSEIKKGEREAWERERDRLRLFLSLPFLRSLPSRSHSHLSLLPLILSHLCLLPVFMTALSLFLSLNHASLSSSLYLTLTFAHSICLSTAYSPCYNNIIYRVLTETALNGSCHGSRRSRRQLNISVKVEEFALNVTLNEHKIC